MLRVRLRFSNYNKDKSRTVRRETPRAYHHNQVPPFADPVHRLAAAGAPSFDEWAIRPAKQMRIDQRAVLPAPANPVVKIPGCGNPLLQLLHHPPPEEEGYTKAVPEHNTLQRLEEENWHE